MNRVTYTSWDKLEHPLDQARKSLLRRRFLKRKGSFEPVKVKKEKVFENESS